LLSATNSRHTSLEYTLTHHLYLLPVEDGLPNQGKFTL
jgi:hypothetical protein